MMRAAPMRIAPIEVHDTDHGRRDDTASPRRPVMQAPPSATPTRCSPPGLGSVPCRTKRAAERPSSRALSPVLLGAVLLFSVLAGTNVSLAVIAALSPLLLLAGVFCGVVMYVWVKDGPEAVREIFKRRRSANDDSPPT